MRFLNPSSLNAAESLALDEAFLDALDAGTGMETLRVWEPGELFVVVGFANSVGTEVNVPVCADSGVPIYRRVSGGGTVLQGPGCLNYSVVLRIEEGGPLASVSGANEFILGRVRDALNPLVDGEIEMRGQTDLTIDGRKFSGNAQKRKRHALLFHGTLLLDFELGLIETYLRMPSKQPDYRDGRGHSDFVTNLNLPAAKVAEALRETWGALETSDEKHDIEVERLVREKYSTDEWNLRR